MKCAQNQVFQLYTTSPYTEPTTHHITDRTPGRYYREPMPPWIADTTITCTYYIIIVIVAMAEPSQCVE